MTVTLERPTLASPSLEESHETMSEELDEMFAAIEAAGTPEGYRWQIVEGQVVMSPQRDVHSHLIRFLIHPVEDLIGRDSLRVLTDVRVDFPGYLNGFAPDMTLVVEGAQPTVGENGEERYGYQDLEIAAEVVSKSSRRTDYGVKLSTYAEAGVPVYVIADPIKALVTVYSEPVEGVYQMINTHHFGAKLSIPYGDGIVIDTAVWPRDKPRPAKLAAPAEEEENAQS
jgi:Uma2 family endonuclease